MFADFDVDNQGRIFLVRISFDGYGCCNINDTTRKMNDEDSRNVLKWAESDDVNHDAMSATLAKYLNQNKDLIWEDALVEHGLL